MSEKIATRDAYGETLLELGTENEDIVVFDADVGSSTRVKHFAAEFPERFFQMGIAEQNMIGTAAGMATCGKIPFVSTFAVFGSARVADQIRNSIAYPELNVKIAVTHAGITVGADGATHQAIEDIGIMRSIPKMTVIVPGDAVEAKQVVRAAADYDGPVYMRFTRGGVPVVFDEEEYEFEWGKVMPVREGSDVTIFATGVMVGEALEAADTLAQEGIEAEVVNVHTIKPIDVEGVVAAAEKTGAVVTAEEHNIYNGLGSAVAEVLGENSPLPMQRVGIKDTFGRSGGPEELMDHFEISSEDVIGAVKDVMNKK
ncbi:transketolase family protein [Acetohalobium arabaticum]|uniref:Transketolase subunit B n=1 Tax=Acetohalobium arabaticum (strain ATCC 49924 / DSM 5501 / Z-7288) TaxID=574087 RepID=D9QU40_ACEAZ|nr:transketolase family protein [Acetohalobium arabaticum]ADL11833.1 transketolase subunit B [Acetohalobium arabaticum DSM 5501]